MAWFVCLPVTLDGMRCQLLDTRVASSNTVLDRRPGPPCNEVCECSTRFARFQTMWEYLSGSIDGWIGGSMVRAVAQWLGRWLVIERSRVRLPASLLSSNNSGQVVHTHVPLSPSSTIWYRPKGGDALQLGR